MSRAARKRAAHRRIQPYAWLGAGAVTLGMGAAMVGGTAVAFADTGAEAGPSSSSSSADASSANADTKSQATKRRPPHVDRARAAADESGQTALQRRSRVPAVPAIPDLTPDIAPAAAVTAEDPQAPVTDNNPAPVAATAPAVTPSRALRSARTPAPEVAVPSLPNPVPTLQDSPAGPAAAVAPAAADPAPSMESWLPNVPIVPGARVAIASGEIKAAQALLNEATWGSGNVIAGIGSLGPQALLATAQLALLAWGATNDAASAPRLGSLATSCWSDSLFSNDCRTSAPQLDLRSGQGTDAPPRAHCRHGREGLLL